METAERVTSLFRRNRFLAALALLVFCTGCAALVAGGVAAVGTVVWVRGNLEEVVEHPVPRVHAVAVDAVKAMGMPVRESQGDALSARVRSEFSDGAEVWIRIDSVDEELTKLSVRVGVAGDRYRSQRILDAIHERLDR